MRIIIHHREDEIEFEARLFDEDGDRVEGVRAQGDRTKILLLNNRVMFRLRVRELSHDAVAFAAIAVFLPFIGRRLHFSFPVSDRVADFLGSNFVVNTVGYPIELSSRTVSSAGTKMAEGGIDSFAIAIGGGVDSVALAHAFKDNYKYHLADYIVSGGVYYYPSYRFLRFQKELQEIIGAYEVVYTNYFSAFSPRGVSTGFYHLIPALLAAADRGLVGSLTGTIFEAAFLGGGKSYSDYSSRFPGNPLRKALSNIGYSYVPGAAGASEVLTTRVCAESNALKFVSFCIKGGFGGPCGRCPKCYRKWLLYQAVKRTSDIPRVEHLERFRVECFDTPFINRLFMKQPLTLASTYSWLFNKLPSDYFIPSLREACAGLGEALALDKFFPEAVMLAPEQIREEFYERWMGLSEVMSVEETALVRAWDSRSTPII